MDIKGKIEEDFKKALKGGDALRLSVLRMIKTALHNKEIEKKGGGKDQELSEEEILSVLNREAKKRKEAILLFQKGNRRDLAEKEAQEQKILEDYLPRSVSREEIESIIVKILSGKKYTPKDFGSAIKDVMKEVKGKADGSMVAEIVREQLEKIA